MQEFSVCLGGKAGDGINRSGTLLCRILARHGWKVWMYYEYPSLIRGGQNIVVIRAGEKQPGGHRDCVDYLLALDQITVDRYCTKCNPGMVCIYNSDTVSRATGTGIDLEAIVRREGGHPVMKNTCLIGAFCRAAQIPFELLEQMLRDEFGEKAEPNIRYAAIGYDFESSPKPIPAGTGDGSAVLSGNEVMALGLCAGGLETYVAYPMSPSTGILHTLAGEAENFGLRVLHPESEIAAAGMTLGAACGGSMAATGTSGGGFCLMTETFSMAGMSETPFCVVLCQRSGPSTGAPTYTGQEDLLFALHAGQGEFPRLVVAPGDHTQAFYWSGRALQLAWEFQVPSLILADKTLCESVATCPPDLLKPPVAGPVPWWDGTGTYERYQETGNGVSPLAVPPQQGAVVKVSRKTHTADGIATDHAQEIAALHDKFLRKEQALAVALAGESPVLHVPTPDATTVICTWGTSAPVCREISEEVGCAVIQPIVLSPFPLKAMQDYLKAYSRLITVEVNSTGQFATLLRSQGIMPDAEVKKYDGRPFTPEDLTTALKEAGI